MTSRLATLVVVGFLGAGLTSPVLAGEFEDRLAEVEARFGAVTPEREVADQTSSEWMSVRVARQAIIERDDGNLEEALRLIGMAATIATAE